ncbi:MAG: N-acetylglucosamine-6-phosphate deacetylase [Chitinophagaceae bacterium]|nr:N-acetylglucosamine-6-phosphate deacetylase [Chitinophagaceae bacterium]
MRYSYAAKKLFTGIEWIDHGVLVVENDIIVAIEQREEKNAIPIIAPALIDLQIYGAGRKLLSVFPEVASIQQLYNYCKDGGANWFQPTVATNATAVIHACIDAVRMYLQEGGKGCIGLHVEGPWINTEKRGAHLASFIHAPTKEEVKALLDYGKGIITMITLAPEIVSEEIIDYIQSRGVVVSAGHTNASYIEATHAFNNGIRTATHLFNAMSPLQHRAPGVVGAILDHATVCCSIVPDGYHVDFAAVRVAKKIMGSRLFAITDAVTNTTTGPYPHQFADDRYEANGILSGSALTMLQCVKNFHLKCDIELGEAIRMCSVYPAKIMGLSHISGRLEINERADFICLEENLNHIRVE